MNKCYNVLIIDDHPSIIEAFENSLNFIANQSDTVNFNTESAIDCKTAYHILQDYTQSQNLDLVILDISLPADQNLKIQSGEDLGVIIRQLLPNTKILVCTSFTHSLRIRHILNAFNPLGFINKQDIGFMGFVSAINDVLSGKLHYSQTIISTIKQKALNNIKLDANDILILKELANGSSMRDLLKLVYLSKSAIDKRKRLLKRKFQIESNSDRDLVLAAKAKGFI
ncbi:response regulator [Winogradskyella eximia]|uniref:response regulator n=1 Tax=Winogradskyella eximia TaxID=262006 RepID=UPI002493BDF8|nr:response regulator [Winogradskyella eximia]